MNSIYSYDMKKLNTDFEFGSGPMGAVHPYRKKQNDERWVGKYLLTRNFEQFQVIMRGINLNCNHDYPGILCPKTVYINECKPKGFRVLVKYPRMKGSLKTIIENQRQKLEKGGKDNYFTKDQVVQYLYSILVGLEYLQKKGIAHTNIKPTNILYGDDGRLRLNDIGLVKEFSDTDTGSFLIHKRGPEFYQPPELFMDNKPQHKSEMLKADIWSLGMVMVELCLLNPDNMFPFSPIDQRKERIKQYAEQIKKLYGEDFAGLIESFLKIEPAERSTAAEIIAKVREMYPGVKELGKSLEEEVKGSPKKPNVIQLVLEDLQNQLGDCFKIDNKKGFSVRANEYPKVTDEKLEELINEFTGKLEERKAEKFEQLSLNFRGCDKITDGGVQKLGARLRTGLKSLKNFSLALGPRGVDEKCAITDDGLRHLGLDISKSLTELQSLSLDFNGCELLTENGIKQVVTDICENMGKLQELSLEFGLHPTRKESKQITDDMIEYITTTIGSKLKGLKSLSLTFRGYPDITDTGLKILEKNICQQIPGLNQLAFKFYRCDRISGEGVKKLADSIREHLRDLHHLTFIFSWCEQVSTGDKAQIKDILRMIPKLTL